MLVKDTCSYCSELGHTKFNCFKKPKKSLKLESKKSRQKRGTTTGKWFGANPPDDNGYWHCYLQISSLCPKRLTRQLLTLEHVYPKVKYPELKYSIDNLKPSCSFCNKLKGSNTVDTLAKSFVNIAIMIQKPEWKAWEERIMNNVNKEIRADQPVL